MEQKAFVHYRLSHLFRTIFVPFCNHDTVASFSLQKIYGPDPEKHKELFNSKFWSYKNWIDNSIIF